MGEDTFSPKPQGAVQGLVKVNPKRNLDFPTAIKEVMIGKKIQKLEWGKGFYGFLDGGFLRLHKPDGKNYSWIISEADLIGDDYIVV